MRQKIGLLGALLALFTPPMMAQEEIGDEEGTQTSVLLMPNAFSPNGDGINDIYKPKEGYQNIKEFHAYIAQCTHNSVITEIMPVITYSIEMYTHFRSKKILKDTIRTHAQITEAICAHDTQKAYDAMYEHVAQNQDGIDMVKQNAGQN